MAYQSYRSQFGDTTFTKVFVGGLAWETPTEEMRRYFQQFGEILEAVIINDKNTGRSKGYGFVTFRDPESARRACVDPNPVIDGRRANCNIASLGRPRPSPPRGRNQSGTSYRGGPPPQLGSTSYNRVAPPLPPPPPPLPALPPPPVMYSPYGYATYTPDYGYQPSFYNPNLQPQYYYQAYGTSSMTPTISSPYSQASRGSFTVPPAHRFQAPSFLHYQPMPSLQGEGSFVTVAPPQPPPRQPVSLSIATSQTPRETSATITGVELTTSRSPDT